MTLDGQERTLDPSMLAICDAERPAVIAGVFGAEFAEVGPSDHPGAARGRDLRRPGDPERVAVAGPAHRVERPLREGPAPRAAAARHGDRLPAAGGAVRRAPGARARWTSHVPAPERPPVRLRWARLPAVLGIEVPREEVGRDPGAPGLRRRGRATRASRRGCRSSARATSPARSTSSRRSARIHGLDRIPTAMPRVVGEGAAHAGPGPRAPPRPPGRRPRPVGGRDLPPWCRSRTPTRCAWPPTTRAGSVVRLAHPMSAEMAVMRRSMLPGLLRAVARNQAHQRADGGLFEIGRTYAPRARRPGRGAPLPRRPSGWGGSAGQGWRDRGRPADLYAATRPRGDPGARPRASRSRPSRTRPPTSTRCARRACTPASSTVGWAGEVHPLVLRAFDVARPGRGGRARPGRAARRRARRAAGLPTTSSPSRSPPATSRRGRARGRAGRRPRGGRARRRRGGAARGPRLRPLRGRAGGAGPREPGPAPDPGRPGRTLTDEEIEAAVDRVRAGLADRRRPPAGSGAVSAAGPRVRRRRLRRRPARRAGRRPPGPGARRHHGPRRRGAGGWWRWPPSTGSSGGWRSPTSGRSTPATSSPSATRTPRRRPWWPTCSSGAPGWSTSRPTTGCATPPSTRRCTASMHPRPDLLAEAVYGLPERYRDAIARRAAGGQPRLLPRGEPARAAPAGRAI